MKSPGKHKKKSRARALWISLAFSVIMLGVSVAGFDEITVHTVGRRLIQPLSRLLAFITIGLALGQIIEAVGWTTKLGRLGAPLFRFARLGQHCSAAFSAAFISGTTANAMLYDFWKEEKISRNQLIMTNLANQLPAFFLHLPTTVFIVLPLTGWAGGLYFLLTFLAAVLRFLFVMMWGRRHPTGPIEQGAMDNVLAVSDKKRPAIQTILGTILGQKLPRRLMTVATYVVPIYIAVFLLSSMGLFDWTRLWLAQWVVTSFLPVEALSLVVLSFVAEYTSGFAAAGALLQEGVLSTKQAVMALLIGNVVAFPIRALRHQMPRLMGIFAPKLGLQILLLGQGFRITSLILIGAVYYMVS